MLLSPKVLETLSGLALAEMNQHGSLPVKVPLVSPWTHGACVPA